MADKPHISKLHDAFHRHRVTIVNVTRTFSPFSEGYCAAFEEAHAKLREELEAMGVAQHFDWNEIEAEDC
jgi:hypothetical protein